MNVDEAKLELAAQRERGEWSGLVDTSGGPIYTLREIASALWLSIERREGKPAE